MVSTLEGLHCSINTFHVQTPTLTPKRGYCSKVVMSILIHKEKRFISIGTGIILKEFFIINLGYYEESIIWVIRMVKDLVALALVL